MLRKGMVFRGKEELRELKVLSIDNSLALIYLVWDDLSWNRVCLPIKVVTNTIKFRGLQLVNQDEGWD